MDEPKVKKSKKGEKILEVLKESGKWLKPPEIEKKTGFNNVRGRLKTYHKTGLVRMRKTGKYGVRHTPLEFKIKDEDD